MAFANSSIVEFLQVFRSSLNFFRSHVLCNFIRAAHQQMDAVAHALERRKTIKRTQTLLLRRRTRVRRSFPSLSEPASKSVSISCKSLYSCAPHITWAPGLKALLAFILCPCFGRCLTHDADSSGLDEELQSCVASRGMLHMFGSNRSTDKQESDESDCDAVSNSPHNNGTPVLFNVPAEYFLSF